MTKSFVIKGVNPATGRVVEITLTAETVLDAKSQAEGAGLEMVTVALDQTSRLRTQRVRISAAPAGRRGGVIAIQRLR